MVVFHFIFSLRHRPPPSYLHEGTLDNKRNQDSTSRFDNLLHFNGFLRHKCWDFASMSELANMNGTWDPM